MNAQHDNEGLKVARLLMVLSSLWPLFGLLAVRGVSLISDRYFVTACIALIVIPTAFLQWRVRVARRERDIRGLAIGKAEDHRDHLLVYLFAMLLPIYAADFTTWRNFWAAVAALLFIVFLFWNLNLHYMNLLFAARGYRVFTVYAPEDTNPHTGRDAIILITRRVSLRSGAQIRALRLSDTVYFEEAAP